MKESEIKNSSLSDHGVRKYDNTIGRFITPDALWEKYYAWSPYHYSANNPVNMSDGNGYVVIGMNSAGQNAILNTLNDNDRGFVKFDGNGYIDSELINSHSSNSSNFQKLIHLINHKEVFVVEVSNEIHYNNRKGGSMSQKLEPTKVRSDWEPGLYSLSTNEVGFQGYTLLPGTNNVWNSTNDNINIIINVSLSKLGRAEILGHELFGHAFLYSLNKNSDHIYGPNNKEMNEELKNESIKSMDEIRRNNKK